jgi:starch phosphorylase
MQPIHTFNVVPKLPEVLEPLREIAMNLWWTWQPDARKLFRYLDPVLWHKTNTQSAQDVAAVPAGALERGGW